MTNRTFAIGITCFACLLTFVNQLIYHYVPSADSLRYLQLAKQYSEGNFLDCVTNCFGHPAYAVFLMLTGFFSAHHYFIGLIQTLLFCCSLLFLAGELKIILKQNLNGLVLLLILVPEIQTFNGYILTESLAISLLLFAFGTSLKIYNQGANFQRLICLSFILAVLSLTRLECFIAVIPILYFIFPMLQKKSLSSFGLVFSIPVLFLFLNAYKNEKIFGVYKLSAFNGGEVIFGGNNYQPDGSHHNFEINKTLFIPQDKLEAFNQIHSQPECLSCPLKDSLYLQMAVESWKSDPMFQIKKIPSKLAKNWLLPADFDIYTADTTKTSGLQIGKLLSKSTFKGVWYAPIKHLFYMLIHWMFLLMISIGFYKAFNQTRFHRTITCLLLFYLCFAVPFCGLPRWHLCIFPLLIITFTPLSIVVWINRRFGWS